jgi:hypothetical protein
MSTIFVDYMDSRVSKIGTFIVSKGFTLGRVQKGVNAAPVVGLDSLQNSTQIAILYPDRRNIIERTGKYVDIGHITNIDGSQWGIEAYGRKECELIKKLAEELRSEFGVAIDIKLVREEPSGISDGIFS